MVAHDIIVDKNVCGGGNDHKDGVVVTRPSQNMEGNFEGLWGGQVPPMHVQTIQNTNAHETIRKIEKIIKLVTCEQVIKTQKRGKQHQNSKKNQQKRTRRQNKKHRTQPVYTKAE